LVSAVPEPIRPNQPPAPAMAWLPPMTAEAIMTSTLMPIRVRVT
jgi:hypothetical protein